jgi:3-isopropylmalate/(R)-2-methylmalate dehydratase small subunit
MEKFKTLKAVAASLPLVNVDTDMIIPARFLKTIKRTGLGKSAFYAMRYDEAGNERPDFVLNQEPYRNSKILIAGANFGCGSSREHAPWSLADFGLRCVIAPSFADIFYGNSFKNGILCITLPQEKVDELAAKASSGNTAGGEFTIDLENNTITAPDGSVTSFTLDGTKRNNLLKGLDDIGITLQSADKITAFETKQHREQPWLAAQQ